MSPFPRELQRVETKPGRQESEGREEAAGTGRVRKEAYTALRDDYVLHLDWLRGLRLSVRIH